MATAVPVDRPGSPPTRVRFQIFLWVFLAGLVAYLQRSTLSVVAVPLTRELGFTKGQIAWLFNAFLIIYAVFQIPGGLFGQRVGPRRATLISIALSTVGTAGFALAPSLVSVSALFLLLAAARLVVGIAQGGLFPTNSGLIEAWFPPRRWALMNGLQVTGLSLGAMLAGPLMSWLMSAHDWPFAVYSTCAPGALLAAAWWWFVRDTPRQDPRVSAAEIAVIESGMVPQRERRFDWLQVRAVLLDRNILLLTLGYLLQNYVYYFVIQWSFSYLVEARGLTMLQGGWLASIPLGVGALCASLGGYWCDLACVRFGPRWGFRLLPMTMMPLAALLLLVAIRADSVYVAVAALAGCFGAAQMTQAPFWAAAFWVAREQTSAATGVLNFGGNVGGIIMTFLVGYLVDRFGWAAAFTTGVGFSLACAATWLLVDAGRRREPAP
jgi:MFS transporter, ACS family, glucarate transporter